MSSYESESRLEDRMIDQLVKQGYSKVVINDVEDLEKNFREQVNIHNKIVLEVKELSDKEFEDISLRIKSQIENLELSNNKLTASLDKCYMDMLTCIIDEEQYLRISENIRKEININRKSIETNKKGEIKI